MCRLKGQASIDYIASAFLFSLVVLFTFIEITSTYYTRSWEMTRADARMDTEKFSYYITKSPGNWSSNPINSTAIGFGGETINETHLRYFMGMAYQTVQNKTRLKKNFRIEVWTLPSIGVLSDVSEFYCNSSTTDLNFETTINSTLNLILVGGEYPNRDLYYSTTVGKFHKFSDTLPTGAFNLKVLAHSGENYGTYEATFRVINC